MQRHSVSLSLAVEKNISCCRLFPSLFTSQIINKMIQELKIFKKLEELEKLTLLSAKEMLTIDEASKYLGMSKDYLYIMTCKKQIPYYKPNGKRLYFKKTELNEWLQRNRVTPVDEAESSAALYIAKKGGNNE